MYTQDQFTQVSPVLDATVRSATYWVIPFRGDKPTPAEVVFNGGLATKVYVAGKLHTLFPYSIYAWGPRCEFPSEKAPPVLSTGVGESDVADAMKSFVKVMSHPIFTRDNLDEGVSCPTCGQLVKMYKRRFNSGMASTLCWLVDAYQKVGTWIDVNSNAPRYVLQSNEISRLVHWGMVVQKENEDTRKRTSGLWKPTDQAFRFVKGDISVPSHVFLLNNNVEGWSDSQLYLKDIKGNRFDYSELMKAL